MSLLNVLGYHSSDCGYCKKDNTSKRTPDSRAAYYISSKTLTPAHYQEFMDRGWRRSGKLLYLPDAARSCCPHYTIRLPAAEFKPSRDHRQCLNRWNRFVLGDRYLEEVKRRYPLSKAEKKKAESSFNLYEAIHESELPSIKPNIEPAHKFEVTLESDEYTDEKYALFQDYQQHVHHEGPEEITQPSFTRFLCSSPIAKEKIDNKELGSFHQCYRLDGRLIAVGVLDLLPHAVSGVYFMYHQDFEKWSLGKLSALRETTLAGERGLEYYYMGFYIHGCDKMRYKATFRQQYVLDYDTFTWDPLDDKMKQLMTQQKYISMSRQRMKEAGEDVNENEWTLQDPLEATRARISLLQLKMPGVMTLEQLQKSVDINTIACTLDRTRGDYHMEDIVAWEKGSEMDSSSLKGLTAEFAACVGPLISREAVMDFSR